VNLSSVQIFQYVFDSMHITACKTHRPQVTSRVVVSKPATLVQRNSRVPPASTATRVRYSYSFFFIY